MYGISNKDAKSAYRLFEEIEGIYIFSPAAVAVASLIKAIEGGKVKPDEHILLNITGGGVKRLMKDYQLYNIPPTAFAENANVPLEDLIA
jgi:cysteate synthase